MSEELLLACQNNDLKFFPSSLCNIYVTFNAIRTCVFFQFTSRLSVFLHFQVVYFQKGANQGRDMWIEMFLPQEQTPSIQSCHETQAAEQQQKILQQPGRGSFNNHPTQKLGVGVGRFPGARRLLQDPVGVDDELAEGRVQTHVVAQRMKPVRDLCVSLQQLKLISFIHRPGQGVNGDLMLNIE